MKTNRKETTMKRIRLRIVALLWATAAFVAAIPAHAATGEGITWTATAGIGYDSNPYLTPSAPYRDLAQPGSPLVIPNKQSGLFVPLGLSADYTSATGMEFSYRFDGELYPSSALSNANSYDHDVTLGWNMMLGSADFYAGMLAGYHRKIYFDRDTGVPKVTTASGTNISNRYNHFDAGGEAKLRQEIGDVEYRLETKLAKLLYSDPIVVAPLDHWLFELGGSGRTPLGSKSTKLKLGYDFALRDYDSRSAFNLQGVQSRANGLLVYHYHTLNAQLFQKFDRNFMAFLDYWHTWRMDRALGYNSYSQDRVKLRLRYRIGQDFLLRASAAYNRKNYPNAFAYDNPVAARKTYNKTEAALKGEYQGLFGGDYGDPDFWIGGNYTKQDSSDLRYVYNRAQIMVGGDWKF